MRGRSSGSPRLVGLLAYLFGIVLFVIVSGGFAERVLALGSTGFALYVVGSWMVMALLAARRRCGCCGPPT